MKCGYGNKTIACLHSTNIHIFVWTTEKSILFQSFWKPRQKTNTHNHTCTCTYIHVYTHTHKCKPIRTITYTTNSHTTQCTYKYVYTATVTMQSILFTWGKFSPFSPPALMGKKIICIPWTFCPWLHRAYDDLITWTKFYSAKYFCNARVAGLSEMFVDQRKIFGCMVYCISQRLKAGIQTKVQ